MSTVIPQNSVPQNAAGIDADPEDNMTWVPNRTTHIRDGKPAKQAALLLSSTYTILLCIRVSCTMLGSKLSNPSQNKAAMEASSLPETQEIYTVSQLNTETRLFLEEAFHQIWILGEISNLARPSSGHLYFSLKDQQAQIRCALFRMNRRGIKFTPENGQQVLLHAQVSLYEARGDFQLIVNHMELAGDGALQIAFEKLKNKLAEEGLFDESHKQAIPELPQCIGIITSATGAAIRDILKVLKRRFPSIPVIIYPSLVQGDQATEQLVKAMKTANKRNECDVLIVSRGGGSLEDLWPFNEEAVARALFASTIPIVTGIGHEVDFTIADFVADQRAATPSAAAEWVSPDKSEYRQQIFQWNDRLQRSISQLLERYQTHLLHLQKRLRHPGQRLHDQAQRLDQLEQSLLLAQKNNLLRKKASLEQLSRALNALSPLKTLERGYSILTHPKTGAIITRAQETKIGDRINVKLRDGKLSCLVELVE